MSKKNKANKKPSKSPKTKTPTKKPAKPAKAAKKSEPKRTAGRPPVYGKTMDKTTMIRMFKADYALFQTCAKDLGAKVGLKVAVGAYLRLAALEKAKRDGYKLPSE